MITQFTGPYRFLSNFYPSPIPWGMEFAPTVEHAFQAAKAISGPEASLVIRAATPTLAKRYGRQVTLRLDWDAVKIPVMRSCLAVKFAAGTELAGLLLGTGDELLLEGNTWGDTYWGVDARTNHGHNWLGVLLMARRAELRGGSV